MRRLTEADFWNRVEKTDSCWNWTGRLTQKGYAHVRWQNRKMFVHRVAFYLAHGRWPMPMCLHSCDNRRCVNPAHLFEGDARANAQDMWQKDRAHRHIGSGHPNAKLTEADIPPIRELLAAGTSQRLIGLQFGVSRDLISKIKQRLVWTHV